MCKNYLPPPLLSVLPLEYTIMQEKMKATILHITHHSIRIFLMLFWLYVALDKLWDLPQFHQALVRQPFPDWWADILYWLLPVTELGTALLFTPHYRFNPRHSEKRSDVGVRDLSNSLPYMLSILMLVVFSGYIALGVAGFYEEMPCGCASALSSLSWGKHLLVNILLLLLSILGWYVYRKTAHSKKKSCNPQGMMAPIKEYIWTKVCCFSGYIITVVKMFRMHFALFPGRPVSY